MNLMHIRDIAYSSENYLSTSCFPFSSSVCHTVCLTMKHFCSLFFKYYSGIDISNIFIIMKLPISHSLSANSFHIYILLFFFWGVFLLTKLLTQLFYHGNTILKGFANPLHVFFIPDTLQHFSSLHKIPHCLHSLLTLLFATHGMEFYLPCSQLKTICWSIFVLVFVIIASLPHETSQLFNFNLNQNWIIFFINQKIIQ